MSDPVTADPQLELVQSLSMAFRTAPIMSRVHDPDHILSDATARHLIGSLVKLGVVISTPGQTGPDAA